MDFCSLNNAFDGKPYYKNIPPIFKSYNTPNKNNLLKEFIQKPVDDGRLLRRYESPLTQVSSTSFIEGKWRDNPQSENKPETLTIYPYPYPYPFCHKKKFVDNGFIKILKGIMLHNKKYAIPYNDLEVCRLCFKTLGNMEYTLQKGDVTFRFSDSILHYYIRHNVWPSKEFYWFIQDY